MIVDLALGLKERDAVSTLSASGRTGEGGPIHTHTHTHTSALIGREMQSGALYSA